MNTFNCFIILPLTCLLLLEAFTTAEEICQPFLLPSPAQSVCSKPQWSQHGVTVAGVSGQRGSSNGTLNNPRGIFISQPDDTLYVPDAGNNRVMKYVLGSAIGLKVAGGTVGENSANQLLNPSDVYVDVEGNIFVADSNNRRLQMWAPNATEGIVRGYMADNKVDTVSGNSQRQDEIYASFGAHLMKYSRNSPASSGSYFGFSSEPPSGMIVDHCDTVYVTRGSLDHNGKLSKFTTSNTTEQILLSGLSFPSDVILDQCGHLFVAEAGKHRIVRYNTRLGGAVEVVINQRGVSGSDIEHLNRPKSLSFDSKWNLYVSDSENQRVQKFEFLSGDMWC